MTPVIAILWVLTVLLDTGGQLALKAAALGTDSDQHIKYWFDMLHKVWLWLGVGCYLFEFLIWLAFLSLVPLSEGVLLGSINIVAIMVGGNLLFREKLNALRVMGILLVAAGVAVVGAS